MNCINIYTFTVLLLVARKVVVTTLVRIHFFFYLAIVAIRLCAVFQYFRALRPRLEELFGDKYDGMLLIFCHF